MQIKKVIQLYKHCSHMHRYNLQQTIAQLPQTINNSNLSYVPERETAESASADLT